MAELNFREDGGKSLRIIIAVLFALIIIFVAIYFILNTSPDEPPYYTASSEEAFELIKNVDNLTVVDIRGLEGCSSCQFNRGHLPNAEMNINYESYYNWTNDILVYSKNGTVGASFCENLSGKVKGKIYNLEGGYETWESKGYPTSDYYIYTTSFSNIAPSEAYDLINDSSNLKVVDIRGLEGCSSCQFNKGHLPSAELNSNPMSLYNLTKDVLVYSKNGAVGDDFCQDIVDHVYGKIYNLEGGYNAWVAAGYPIH